MKSEQAKVDKLYPVPKAGASSQEWLCPLLRVSFWSKVTENFSPLSPSPVRAARLFGGASHNMIYGTRSHPTQLFSSLYTRLGDVHTSNGFCYCLNAAQCQVSHSAGNDCTLLETLKSLYDQKFRTARYHLLLSFFPYV